MNQESMMKIKPLLQKDVKDFLEQLSAAIVLDQVYVDSLPPETFSPMYDDDLWRTWRCGHRAYLEKLLSTAYTIQPVMLARLTKIATVHEPAVVGKVVLEHLALVVGGCMAEDFGTAERFFSWLIEEMKETRKCGRRYDARASILRWLPINDPLRISRDPECAYVARA
jgi:hypothetical protein